MSKKLSNYKEKSMEWPVVVWVDLTQSQNSLNLFHEIDDYCDVYRIAQADEIDGKIYSLKPNVLCFEFDCPDSVGLITMSQTKRKYPQIPVIMLTEYHSEALAIWAFRARVWDYLVKPLKIDELLQPISALLKLGGRKDTPRQVIQCERDVYAENCTTQTNVEKTIFKAQRYVESHISDKLSASDVARTCAMSPSHFSRAFKRVCGMTFSEFVLKTRLKIAMKLLVESRCSVTTVSYEAGFHDPSYFARIFRRHVGITPTVYRQKYSNEESEISTLTTELAIGPAGCAGGSVEMNFSY